MRSNDNQVSFDQENISNNSLNDGSVAAAQAHLSDSKKGVPLAEKIIYTMAAIILFVGSFAVCVAEWYSANDSSNLSDNAPSGTLQPTRPTEQDW